MGLPSTGALSSLRFSRPEGVEELQFSATGLGPLVTGLEALAGLGTAEVEVTVVGPAEVD